MSTEVIESTRITWEFGSSRGAAERISAIIRDYRPMFMRFIIRIGTHRDHAEDIFPETMVRARRHLHPLPCDRDGERRWLFAVARHLVIDGERRRHVRPAEVSFTDYPGGAGSTGDDHTSEPVIARDALRAAFRGRTPMHQEILLELYYGGKSVAEVSRALGIPAGTVKSRAHYGMRLLRAAVTAVEEASMRAAAA